ncbi:MAG: transporter [Flavobacteriaceae bacterium]|jgi:outer membrane protein TolC|nr:transporter [Flavobacteriaceae bacterium]|tara:strand:- start:174151 stop:175401 length:1251 start_codon:yes stop_codon:yes gene_type:complete
MKRFIVILITLFTLPVVAQQTLTLQECYGLAAVNFPLAKQSQLLEAQKQFDKEIISNEKLPQLSLDAQATYQSDVIEIPIPNSTIEPLNKDQYRATLSVNQLIYNGGAIDASLDVKSAQIKTKQKQVEVNLYQLKQQINQYYFSILLAQETDALLKAKQTQLQSKLSEVKIGIEYGAVLPASDKVLEAELLKINQQFIEVKSNKIVLIESLSNIIGQPLDTSTTFQKPLVQTHIDTELNRPELDLFQLKKDEIESNKALIAKQNTPKLLGFATGGYGNPGLNMLDNSFQPFYTLGVKLNWNVFDWNSNKKQRESLSINKDIIDTETETFKLNTNTKLNQQQREIEKIEAFITSDLEIINLRKEVLKSADSQLKNGVITSSAYITELTNLYEDENTLIQHKIQLQLAKANYNIIKGQ